MKGDCTSRTEVNARLTWGGNEWVTAEVGNAVKRILHEHAALELVLGADADGGLCAGGQLHVDNVASNAKVAAGAHTATRTSPMTPDRIRETLALTSKLIAATVSAAAAGLSTSRTPVEQLAAIAESAFPST